MCVKFLKPHRAQANILLVRAFCEIGIVSEHSPKWKIVCKSLSGVSAHIAMSCDGRCCWAIDEAP